MHFFLGLVKARETLWPLFPYGILRVRDADGERISKQGQYICLLGCGSQQEESGLSRLSKGLHPVPYKTLTWFIIFSAMMFSIRPVSLQSTALMVFIFAGG